MTTSAPRTARLALPLGAAALALLSACSSGPRVVQVEAGPPPPATPLLLPQRNIEVSQRVYKASEALGSCVSSETVSRPEGSPPLRTGGTINCGYINPGVLAATGTRLPDVRSLTKVSSYRFATPNFNDMGRSLTCETALLLVPADTPGAKVQAGAIVPEFDNYMVPAGWAIPARPVNADGRVVSSSVSCRQPFGIRIP